MLESFPKCRDPPLLVHKCLTETADLFLQRSAEIFCQGPVKKLGTTGVLYVIQREYATVCVDDGRF